MIFDFFVGCVLRVNGDLGQPQPVYMRNGEYLEATGATGLIHLSTGEQLLIACTGSGRTIVHPNLAQAGLQTAVSIYTSKAVTMTPTRGYPN